MNTRSPECSHTPPTLPSQYLRHLAVKADIPDKLAVARDVVVEVRHHRLSPEQRCPAISEKSDKTRSDIEADATEPLVSTTEAARGRRADARALLWVPTHHLRQRRLLASGA